MKRTIILLIAFALFCSCESEDKRIDRICSDYLASVLPNSSITQMQSRTPIEWDSESYCYKTDVTYAFQTNYGYSGTATMTLGLDSDKKSVKQYWYPNNISISDCSVPYSIYNSTIERAFDQKKAVFIIAIPERYSVQQLDTISHHIYYRRGYLCDNCQVSFYLKGMSLKGPNYAIAKIENCKRVFVPDIEINPLTAVSDPKSLSVETQKQNPKAPFANAEVIGNYQYIGNSTITVYKKGGRYYMVTFADGDYQKPDALVNLGSNRFKYVEDTGEIFKAQSDGLYCYFEGDLGAVYHAI